MINLANATELVTTSGVIALLNLQAQIDGLEAQSPSTRLRREHRAPQAPARGRERSGAERLTVAQRADLIDLLLLRGQVLGRIADYEHAAALADQLVQDAPSDGIAFLARARTHATFHRFSAAFVDLDAAESRGLEPLPLNAERAAILQALGRYDEALAVRLNAVAHRSDFATLGALAGLQAERGEVAEAERLFSAGRQRYQGISPFPVALLDFQRGLMWLEQGDLSAARSWFDAALCRLPGYTAAQGHRAEVDAALGERDAAITRLRPLTVVSDDPEYAALLAGLLSETGQSQESRRWRIKAAARYDELLVRHPAAFADHAVEFWLTTGADAERALKLAGENLAICQTPRAYALLQRAAAASASY